ncbi:unnamed protein product [Rotaria magnacalcarata]|uniref:Uncharacterized protein n=1 Tax=Rotaria magnacalcarata TaxID=392030 RepID=A0A815P9L3_9BILA|nr:unnamed protein product [Rotaria magnacalcarata]CAF4653411.1 unnamed protein product [Rotaria magnacalcarata]
MTETLETRLYKTLKRDPDFDMVKQLIYDGVDCNLSYFDRYSRTFQSPIQLTLKTDRRETLHLLYKHRNSPTRIQLKKQLTFYINHNNRLQKEKNEILFHYTVSRLLYTRITEHSKIVFDTLIAALHDYDHAKYRTCNLSEGSTAEIFLQLRIYTLFQKIIEMKINSNNNESTIIEEELLHNLETYYFLISIKNIPVIITREMINQTFSIISMHKPHLKKYYQSIAKNVISKIEKLKRNQVYTIPTGWIGHAVCVSFQRINETHIVIRIDNPAPDNPPDIHKIVHSMKKFNITQPKILGQLHVDHLEMNLNYFILLIDSVKRDLTFEDGTSLIYNLDGQIINLDKMQNHSFSRRAHDKTRSIL